MWRSSFRIRPSCSTAPSRGHSRCGAAPQRQCGGGGGGRGAPPGGGVPAGGGDGGRDAGVPAGGAAVAGGPVGRGRQRHPRRRDGAIPPAPCRVSRLGSRQNAPFSDCSAGAFTRMCFDSRLVAATVVLQRQLHVPPMPRGWAGESEGGGRARRGWARRCRRCPSCRTSSGSGGCSAPPSSSSPCQSSAAGATPPLFVVQTEAAGAHCLRQLDDIDSDTYLFPVYTSMMTSMMRLL